MSTGGVALNKFYFTAWSCTSPRLWFYWKRWNIPDQKLTHKIKEIINQYFKCL